MNINIYRRLMIASTVFLLSACGPAEQTDVMFECVSASGNKVATFYSVSTPNRPNHKEMKLNIRQTGTEFNDARFSLSYKDGFDAIIRWKSDTEIDVQYPEDSALTHQEMVILGTSQTFSSSEQIRVNYTQSKSVHGYFMVEKRCFR